MDAIKNLAVTVYDQITAVSDVALVFFLLAIFIHRRNLRSVLTGLLPRGLKVNLIAYLIDTMLIAAPLYLIAKDVGIFMRSRGITLVPREAFEALPAFVVGFAAVFLGDMVGYFRHRLEHSRLLWSSHVMHHSDSEMSWFTLYRFHPINRLTTTLIDLTALLLMGFPAWAIVLNGVVRHYYGLLIHANVPWDFGALGKVFVSPAMHRWHHVRRGAGVSRNFATVFCVFDRALGTFYLPGPCNEPTGVDGVPDEAYVQQILLPPRELIFALRSRLATHRVVAEPTQSTSASAAQTSSSTGTTAGASPRISPPRMKA